MLLLAAESYICGQYCHSVLFCSIKKSNKTFLILVHYCFESYPRRHSFNFYLTTIHTLNIELFTKTTGTFELSFSSKGISKEKGTLSIWKLKRIPQLYFVWFGEIFQYYGSYSSYRCIIRKDIPSHIFYFILLNIVIFWLSLSFILNFSSRQLLFNISNPENSRIFLFYLVEDIFAFWELVWWKVQ